MSQTFDIGSRRIGAEFPTYIIAELSANHNRQYEKAVELVHASAEAGVDAIKLQTYTADTLTIDCNKEHFRVAGGTLWDGRTLYDLYDEAHTPWEWHGPLKSLAEELGMDCFSTPFDASAVEFLESLDVVAHKIASFEIVDIPLIKKVAETGKPVIMSTGMASIEEIEIAVATLREHGCGDIALLKCTSAYPAQPEDMNLAAIPELKNRFDVLAGLSDHTLGIEVPIASVMLGARIIEKHMTLDRTEPGPDSAFSLEPDEFKDLVQSVRNVERAVGVPVLGTSESEDAGKNFRKSIFVVKDVRAGEMLTESNVRVIRPGYGLAPRYYEQILGSYSTQDLERGTPLKQDHCTAFQPESIQ